MQIAYQTAPRKSNISKTDARANRLNTFAFVSECSFLNSADRHSDTRLSRLRIIELPAWRLAMCYLGSGAIDPTRELDPMFVNQLMHFLRNECRCRKKCNVEACFVKSIGPGFYKTTVRDDD